MDTMLEVNDYLQLAALIVWMAVVSCAFVWGLMATRKPIPAADARDIHETVEAERAE